jgi:hypothetical protein
VVNGDAWERHRSGSGRGSCEGAYILWLAVFVTTEGPKGDGDDEQETHDVPQGGADGPAAMWALANPNLPPSSRGLESPEEVTPLFSCNQRVRGTCRKV